MIKHTNESNPVKVTLSNFLTRDLVTKDHSPFNARQGLAAHEISKSLNLPKLPSEKFVTGSCKECGCN